MTEIEERGREEVIADAIAEALDGPDCIYLSVDIDVVDPGIAPGTGTPEPGGMLARELLRAVRQIVSQVDLVGMDVVEVAPPYDHAEITANLAHRVVMEAISALGSSEEPRERRRAHGEIADNRKLWDAWTAIHTTGAFYDVQRFRDDPTDVRIAPLERAEVGDVDGQVPAPPAMPFRAGHAVVGPRSGPGASPGSTSASGPSRSRRARGRDRARRPGAVRRVRHLRPARLLAGETFDVEQPGRS